MQRTERHWNKKTQIFFRFVSISSVHLLVFWMEYRYRLKVKTMNPVEQPETSQSSTTTTTERRTVDATTLPSSSMQTMIQDRSSSPPMAMKSKKSNWKKDQSNIIVLLFLYLLQGVPLGMAGSIPLIIQTIGVSWSQQATFSFAFWPFSLKLLWAPLVDAVYMKRFGRRKSWLIPTQYLIGIVMIILSYYINDVLKTTTSTTGDQPRTQIRLRSIVRIRQRNSFRYLFSHGHFLRSLVSRCNTRCLCRRLGAVDVIAVNNSIVRDLRLWSRSAFSQRECRLGQYVQFGRSNGRLFSRQHRFSRPGIERFRQSILTSTVQHRTETDRSDYSSG